MEEWRGSPVTSPGSAAAWYAPLGIPVFWVFLLAATFEVLTGDPLLHGR
jgi:hypothetical protein